MLKKRLIIMSAALLIVFGGLLTFNWAKNILIKRYFAQYEPPAVAVSSVTAIQQDWEPRLPAVGSFLAINGVDVNAETSGNVVAIHFDSGQYVTQGTPLIDINDQIEQAVLKFNQAELALQEISYKRQLDLYKRGATPNSSVDEAKARLDQAQANLEKTQAEIRQKHITAPFSGRLGIRQVNLGQYISPGQPPIVTLQSMDPLFLEFYLPEQLLQHLHLNQGLVFSVDQNPELLFKGTITAINAKADVRTHTVRVQATLPNCPALTGNDLKKLPMIQVEKEPYHDKLLVTCNTVLNQTHQVKQFNFIPGMFASIEIQQPMIKDTILLPSTAISYSLYGDAVFIIEPSGKVDQNGDDRLIVKRVFITTGEQRGNFTVIKKGVEAGQQVVSTGELKLKDGTFVTINNDVELGNRLITGTLKD